MFHIIDSTVPITTYTNSSTGARLALTEEDRDDLCDAEQKYRYRKDDPEAFERYWVRTVEKILARHVFPFPTDR